MKWNWLFGRNRSPRAPIIVAFLVLVNALMLRVGDPSALARLRDLAFDGFQRLHPRQVPPDLPVRIVDIDEAALAEYGQWPWPRYIVAQLVDKLAEKGAAAVAFDVVFAEPDRSSLSRVVQSLPPSEQASELQRIAAKYPDNDQVLAQSIKNAPVVTGFGFDLNGGTQPPRRFAGLAHNTGEAKEANVASLIATFIPEQAGVVRTLDMFEKVAKGNGSVTTEIEGAIVRRVPLLFRLKGQRVEDLFPALSLEALRVAQGASTYLMRWAGAQGLESFGARTGMSSIRVGNFNIDTDAEGRIELYDSGHMPQRFVSARDVLNGTLPDDKIDGHIILIGTSAVGLKDLRNTPLQDSIPGVEVHAQILEQVLSQTFLERPDYADGAEFLYLLAIGLVFVILLPRLPAATMALVAALFIAIGIAVPWYAFNKIHLLFDPIYPPVTLAAIYIIGSALSFMRAERDRREIHGAFSLYLSPDQVKAVVENPDLLALGGEMREITVLFSDVRGFTTISEQFDPAGLTRFMNRLLTPMTDLIQERKGTIDKYMGDAIMAFWNAPVEVPNHPVLACETVLAMQARLLDLNAEWKAEADAEGRLHIPVNIGVGLNTGQATVGNFGSTQRLQYSCLGDEVNLASRLEGLCKAYAVGIIIGENTWQQASDFAAIELDLVMVKGKTEPERIFGLIGPPEMAKRPEYQMLLDRQAAFLLLYRTGAFAEALPVIQECAEAAQALGWRQGYYDVMWERVDHLIDDSPPDWNGVYVAKEK
jgi:adenylate cyclase